MQPLSPERGFASPADLAACREMLRDGSRSFFAASLLLPEKVRQPACVLYAFCRLADDAVDLRRGRLEAVAGLRDRLAAAYAGRPRPHAVDRALADVVAAFDVPRTLPEALFEGLEWDATGRRYEDLAALRAYAARVAGSVGAMMAVLMGARDAETVARACDLGIAMQLTNIARDIGEDARDGRLYLPLAWLREAGIDPDAWLARPVFDPALGLVVRRLLRHADELYARADPGIARLPLDCRPGIHAARLIYAEIGREVERLGLDSVGRRAVVGSFGKARLLLGALLATARPGLRQPASPVDEARFLIDATASAALSMQPPAGTAPWWHLGRRAIWVLDLFERLERRQRIGKISPKPMSWHELDSARPS